MYDKRDLRKGGRVSKEMKVRVHLSERGTSEGTVGH